MSVFSRDKIINPSYCDLDPSEIHPTATRGCDQKGIRIRLTYEEERNIRHEKSKPIISLVRRLLNQETSKKEQEISELEKTYKKKGGRRKLNPFVYDDDWCHDDDYAENVVELNNLYDQIEILKEKKFDFWPKTKYDLVLLFKEKEKEYNALNDTPFFSWTESIDFEIRRNRFIMINIKPSDYDLYMIYKSNNEKTGPSLLLIADWIKEKKGASIKYLSKQQWTSLIAQWIIEKRKRKFFEKSFVFYPSVKVSKFDYERTNFYEILMEDVNFQIELFDTYKKDMKKTDSVEILEKVKLWIIESKKVSLEELKTYDYYQWAGNIRDYTTENNITVKKSMIFRPPVCEEDIIPYTLNYYRIQKDNFNDTEEDDDMFF
jgi:hypothetical protein